MNQTQMSYKCPKCGHAEYEVDQIRTTGGGFSKIFDVQNKKFVAVSCTRCKYTEFYKSTTSSMGNILDFFTRG
jgi:uncharacterized protein